MRKTQSGWVEEGYIRAVDAQLLIESTLVLKLQTLKVFSVNFNLTETKLAFLMLKTTKRDGDHTDDKAGNISVTMDSSSLIRASMSWALD